MMILLILLVPFLASFLSFFVKNKIKILNFLTISASVLELFAGVVIVSSVIKTGSYPLNSYFSVDALGSILILILIIVGGMVSLYSTGYLKEEVLKGVIGFSRVKQYFILLNLFLFAMFFAVTTTSPILMWIAIEATTLSTAFLISFYNKPSSIEAAWKYLIINSVGLLLAFFGTLLFLYPTIKLGFHGLSSWQTIIAHAAAFNPFIVKIAFIFIVIGYGTKTGLVPLHTWLPDAHSKAPAPISSLLSGILLNVAFLAILRFKLITDTAIGVHFSQSILIFFGVLSVVVASFMIFGQKNYKRLLAYSSIEHMGIISLGFGFGGFAAFAALLHMVYHSLVKSVLFMSAGNIFLKYSSTKIKNIKGALSVLPITGIFFIVGFLAITGVPPFGIFITEFSILAAGISTHPVAVIAVLCALALVFVGFLRHIVAMMFGDNTNKDIAKSGEKFIAIAPVAVLIFVLVILSFIIPAPLKYLITSATSVY